MLDASVERIGAMIFSKIRECTKKEYLASSELLEVGCAILGISRVALNESLQKTFLGTSLPDLLNQAINRGPKIQKLVSVNVSLALVSLWRSGAVRSVCEARTHRDDFRCPCSVSVVGILFLQGGEDVNTPRIEFELKQTQLNLLRRN